METNNLLPNENINLISDMNTKIKHLGEGNKNIVEFWQETIDIIKETILQTTQAQNYARILRVWSAGINKIEEEFNLNKSQNVEEIFKLTSEMTNDNTLDKSIEALEKLYKSITELEWRTEEVFNIINKNKHQNPLLALPAIRKAIPLKRDMIFHLKPNELYLSTIKAIILKNDDIEPIEADKKVCLLLKEYNVPKNRIFEAMLASPTIAHLDFKEKRITIMQELNKIYSKNNIYSK